jgi:ribosomal protein S4
MRQVFKWYVQKKYKDEVFGSIILSWKFSYLRKVLLNEYKLLKSNCGRVFLSNRYYRKLNFLHFLNMNFKLNIYFRRSWDLFKLKSFNNSKKNSKDFFLKKKIFYCLNFYLTTFWTSTFRKLSSLLLSSKSYNYMPNVFRGLMKRRAIILQHFNFLLSRLDKQATIYPKNEFFYMVHIASPRKQRPRRSVFTLKQMYLRKLGVYMGFNRLTKFIRVLRSLDGARSSRIRTFSFFESRLCILLIRVNLFTSIYLLRRLIENGYIFVNNLPKYDPDYMLKPSEIVTIERNWSRLSYGSLVSRLRRKQVLINYPPYLEVDYKTQSIIMVDYPNVNSLTSPASFDLQGYPFFGGVI